MIAQTQTFKYIHSLKINENKKRTKIEIKITLPVMYIDRKWLLSHLRQLHDLCRRRINKEKDESQRNIELSLYYEDIYNS